MIITLCGSASFELEFKRWNDVLTSMGYSIFTLSSYPSDHKNEKDWHKTGSREIFDLVYFNKIANSNAILVLDYAKDGIEFYIGESAKKEICWAKHKNKAVIYANKDLKNEPLNIKRFLPDPMEELLSMKEQFIKIKSG